MNDKALFLIVIGIIIFTIVIAILFVKIKWKIKYPLHHACKKGNTAKFHELFKENHNIDLRDNKGKTLLHCAAESNNIEIMKTLIDSGININATNKYGNTVLHNRNWKTTEPIKFGSSGYCVGTGIISSPPR
ncbi:MAG: ankyrin repeat domain-containing protein [bacterium]|nr:ankyrin repeat domain-containing protein [bacterium]